MCGSLITHFIAPLYHCLLPPRCVLCSYPTHQAQNICHPCQQDLPILAYGCCQCAQVLPSSLFPTPLCHTCRNTPPPFDLTYALFPYEPPIIQLILALKFRQQLSNAQALGELLHQRIQHEWYQGKPLPDLIIPVPLHPRRLQERGFNQALEIARPISKKLYIPIDRDGVHRIKYTAAQSGLSATERKRNMIQAFSTTRDYTGLSVAVIDDVITTGHTISELCSILARNGTKNIHVWCCAKRMADIALETKPL